MPAASPLQEPLAFAAAAVARLCVLHPEHASAITWLAAALEVLERFGLDEDTPEHGRADSRERE